MSLEVKDGWNICECVPFKQLPDANSLGMAWFLQRTKAKKKLSVGC
jgi:hypothetical protein